MQEVVLTSDNRGSYSPSFYGAPAVCQAGSVQSGGGRRGHFEGPGSQGGCNPASIPLSTPSPQSRQRCAATAGRAYPACAGGSPRAPPCPGIAGTSPGRMEPASRGAAQPRRAASITAPDPALRGCRRPGHRPPTRGRYTGSFVMPVVANYVRNSDYIEESNVYSAPNHSL